jgi:ferredoxin
MITVKFINAEDESQEAQGVDGQSLLDLAQAVGQPLEGTCEGQMACSTCHVIIDKDWFDKLPPAVEDEEDMLDLATGARRTSRLSCQITLTPALDGMVVHVPAESRNMQGL